MTAVLAAYAVVLTVACFVVTAMVVGAEIRDHLATKRPQPVAPRIPAQRSAAAIVPVHDAQAFEEFLRELIVTTHVEDVLS